MDIYSGETFKKNKKREEFRGRNWEKEKLETKEKLEKMGTKSSKRENILIFFPCLICALMTAKKQRREFQKIQGGGGRFFLVAIINTTVYV